MYINNDVCVKYFSMYGGDIASNNILSAHDSDKAPIMNIIDPKIFGLSFITIFRFDIIIHQY